MFHLLAAESVGHFIDWGFVHLSVGNLVVIVAMLVIFVLAIVLPFPSPREPDVAQPPPPGTADTGSMRQEGSPR